MTKAQSLYADESEWAKFSYQPILDSFGEILIHVEGDNYFDTCYVMYKSGDKVGFLDFVIALADCPYDEADNFINYLENRIRWFDYLPQAQFFCLGQYWTSHDDYPSQIFYNKCIEYFHEEILQ